MGLIAVDTQGRIGAAHNTPNLCWVYITPNTTKPKAAMHAKTVSATKTTTEKTWENANL